MARSGTLDWTVPEASAYVVADKLLRARNSGEQLTPEAMASLNITMKRTPLIHAALRSQEKCTGWKIGFTGATVPPAYVGLAPIMAPLLSSSVFYDADSSNGVVTLKHPRGGRKPLGRGTFGRGASQPLMLCAVEAEFCFILHRDLTCDKGIFFDDPPLTEAMVWEAIGGVAPALEVLGSRVSNVDLTTIALPRPAVAELVADFGGGAYVIIGHPVDKRNVDLESLISGAVELKVNNLLVGEGTGAKVLGSPLKALAWLANARAALGDPLRAGDVVMTGACIGPLAVQPGDAASATFAGLGTVECKFD